MFLQQLDDKIEVFKPWFKDFHFHLVDSLDKLRKLIDICLERKLCSLDCETTGVDNRIYTDEFFEDGVKTRHGIRTVSSIVGLCLSFDGLHGYYIPLKHEPEDSGNLPWDPVWDEITRLFNGCRIIFHNSKFDAEFLYPVTGREYWKLAEYEDTYLMANVINPLRSSPAGLKPLTKHHFNIDMVELDELFTTEKKLQLVKEKRGLDFSLLHPKEGLEYGCSDGIFTYKLFFALQERLNTKEDQSIYNLEKSFCNVIRKMERNRVHIDVNRVNQLYTECQNAMLDTGDLAREIIEGKTGKTGKWRTLNIGSPVQLSEVFFTDHEGLKLKPVILPEDGTDPVLNDQLVVGDSKQYSTKDEVFKLLNKVYGEKLRIKRKDGTEPTLFDIILEYRHYDKMKGSYIEKLFLSHDKYGDVRPSFNQMGTDTARLSSKAGEIENGYSGINFQGIPRDSDDDKPELFKQIRTCIAPRDGWVLVKLDFAGEELRVVTNLSGDRIWTKSFLYEDGDVHSITSRILFSKNDVSKDERNRGKRSNFAFIYGGGAGAIQRNVGCSMEEAQRHMNNLRDGVPELMAYVDHQKHFAKKNKCIYTAFGRRIPIPTIDSPIKAIRRKAERCAINYTIQATSADVIKFAMCFLDKNIRQLGWENKVRYILTVHDEVVFEVRPDALMEVIPKLDEWMTYPWKLPKAHGREWVVPLETEPGIDIHWRARYDFFLMTRGSQPKPKEIDKDGNFIGTLKKGYHYDNGKIYQDVPDFLQSYIHKTKPSTEPVKPVEAKPVEAKPIELAEKPIELPQPEVSKPIELVIEAPKSIEVPKSSPGPIVTKPDSMEDEDLLNTTSSDSPLGIEIDDDDEPEPTQPKPVQSHEQVLRWTIQAVLSEVNSNKLHAVCLLAPGNTPLRIVDQKGQIVVSENEGIRVDPQKFQILTDLFGLG